MKKSANLTANERYYRKVLISIGITMLIFVLLINAVSVLIVLAESFLLSMRLSPIAAEVIYQLIYAAGYLSAFMLPVLFLKLMIKKAGYCYQPMKTSIRLSPLLFPIIVGGMVLIWAQSYINSALVSIFNYSVFSSEVLWGSSESLEPYQIVLNFIVIGIVPAFCEEFLFRGAILTNCLPFGRTNAILISALLFGLMHQNAEQILYAFAAGIFLGVVYERTGSIWNCTFLHLMNNFASIVISVIAERFGGLRPDIAGIALEAILCVVGMICIAILVIRMPPKKQSFDDGVFGKSVPATDSYASSPVTAKQAFRHFLNAPMVIFLVICVIQIVVLLLFAMLYGSFA